MSKALDLDAILARANAATPGPWKVCNPPPCKHGWPTIGVPIPATGDEVDDDCHHVTDLDDCIKIADAAFIAAAREDVPDLVAAVREARDWACRLTAEQRVLTCVYCGHAYPPGSPAHGADVLTAHVAVCEKHPMAALRKRLDALGSLDGIRTAALALPVEDRHRLRAELAATLPLPLCYVPVPALLAHEAGRMTPAEVEELIGLLMKRRPS